MKIFTPLYNQTMAWSRQRRATRYLAVVSFLESSVFPVPTALMLAPMVLANRDRAWRLASLATITSVLGGVFGYLIGHFLFAQLGQPLIDFYHGAEKFAALQRWFDKYGAWAVLLAGATPIPYKIFTLASGLFGLPLAGFVAASVVGRGAQFFVIAGVLRCGGGGLQKALEKWMEIIGWAVAAAVVAYFAWG